MTAGKTLKQLDDALALLKPFHNCPPPKDEFASFQWSMAGAHGLILTGLKNFYVKAASIQPADRRDFILFVLFWVSLVEHHHKLEEDWFFDALNGSVKKTDIVEEHDGFRHQIHDLQTYLESCLPIGTNWGCYGEVVPTGLVQRDFDAKEFERVVEVLVDAFLQHFCDEIGYLDAARIRTTLSYEDCRALAQRLDSYIISQATPFHVYSYLHRPSYFFPPMPWFVKNILCPWVFYWANRNMWRFAPTTPY